MNVRRYCDYDILKTHNLMRHDAKSHTCPELKLFSIRLVHPSSHRVPHSSPIPDSLIMTDDACVLCLYVFLIIAL